MTYTVQQLAAGSYDDMLDGVLIKSVVREVDRSGAVREWLLDLLDETSPAERPAPLRAQQHAFAACAATLEWLGVRREVEFDGGSPMERKAP